MDKLKIDYTLYLCTDRGLMSCETIEQSVEEGVKGGCTVIQLREKDCTSREFYELAVRVKKITDKYSVPLIINDRLDIAQAVDCAGVHLGQSDMPCAVARKILGEDKIIGISAATLEEAKKHRQTVQITLALVQCMPPTQRQTQELSQRNSLQK